MSDAENMAEEFFALASMSDGEEREEYMRRYRLALGVLEEPTLPAEPPLEVSINTRDCEPMQPETLGALATMFKAAYDQQVEAMRSALIPFRPLLNFLDNSRIPCPRCGQLAELRTPAGAREAWECPACGFGFDLPADPVE